MTKKTKEAEKVDLSMDLPSDHLLPSVTKPDSQEIVGQIPPALNGMPGVDSAMASAQSMVALIERLAMNPDVDVTKMEALLNMQERILNRQALTSFTRAFSAMSQVLPRIVKEGSVAYDKVKGDPSKGQEEAFKFAKFEDIDEIVRPIMFKYGFVPNFTTKERAGGGLIVVGTLTHCDGHQTVCELPLAIDTSGGKNNLQGMGSTSSYGRRYATCILLNLITIEEDNDGRPELEAVDSTRAVEIDQALREKTAIYDEENQKYVRARFLKFMEVDDIRSIAQKDYLKAMNAIAAIGQNGKKPEIKKEN